jgi:hypothetical protein
MLDDARLRHLSAAQYRERAKLVLDTAVTVKSADLRGDLLHLASEYDKLAESTQAMTSYDGK